MVKLRREKRSVLAFLLVVGAIFVSNPKNAFSQKQTKVVCNPVVADIVGGYLEHLPDDYASNPSKKYPLLLFIHGIGEVGTGSETDLNKVYRNGPPNLLENGKFPSSFTVNGETFKFIVISPQFQRAWPSTAAIEKFFAYLQSKYRVDADRIYLTGLSMGGGRVWDYAAESIALCNQLAAIAPICGASAANRDKANLMASQNLPIWAFHNQNDPSVAVTNTTGYVNYFNQYTPKASPQAKATIYPMSGHNAWGAAYDPNNREEGKNLYEWMLQYKRRINGKPNTPSAKKAPLADAGADQTIKVPTETATLSGAASKDPDGTIKSYAWSFISGPATPKLSSTSGASITVSNIKTVGNYVFQLTVTDNDGLVGIDQVVVTLASSNAQNKVPWANAGPDITMALPLSSTYISSRSTDPDGIISYNEWTQVSGPATMVFGSPNEATTQISGLTKPGKYTVKLLVRDNQGATATDELVITVTGTAVDDNPKEDNPSGGTGSGNGGGTDSGGSTSNPKNQSPWANAGPDVSILLPVSSVTLTSRSVDPDGTIVSSSWTQTNGPVKATFANATAASTVVSGMTTAGTYIFKLTVKDNDGATASDEIIVSVTGTSSSSGKNSSPWANAGPDINLTLPTSSATLKSSSVDPDGNIVSSTWVQTSGPQKAALSSPDAPTTNVSGMTVAGSYVFRLTVTDDMGAVASDEVIITVFVALAGKPSVENPVADAGPNIQITLPTSSVTLASVTSDPGGLIKSYAWVQTAGRVTAAIANPNSARTTVSGLTTAGTYTFGLKITTTDGNSTNAYVSVVVVDAKSNARSAGTSTASTTQALAATAENKIATPEEGIEAKVYPNPAHDVVTVQINGAKTGNGQVSIINNNGVVLSNKIITKDLYTSNQSMSVSQLTAGIYYMSVQVGQAKPAVVKFQKL